MQELLHQCNASFMFSNFDGSCSIIIQRACGMSCVLILSKTLSNHDHRPHLGLINIIVHISLTFTSGVLASGPCQESLHGHILHIHSIYMSSAPLTQYQAKNCTYTLNYTQMHPNTRGWNGITVFSLLQCFLFHS